MKTGFDYIELIKKLGGLKLISLGLNSCVYVLIYNAGIIDLAHIILFCSNSGGNGGNVGKDLYNTGTIRQEG